MYNQRHLEGQIKEASRHYPVVMVCGQQQVGKSTMLNHIKEKERRYVTLDDGNARRLADEMRTWSRDVWFFRWQQYRNLICNLLGFTL